MRQACLLGAILLLAGCRTPPPAAPDEEALDEPVPLLPPRLAARAEEAAASNLAARVAWTFAPPDVARPPEFPALGKWLLDPQRQPARWLGEPWHGRELREPINVILVDTQAATAAVAVERLFRNFHACGYRPREGHSTGYQGGIGGFLYPQLPRQAHTAFSDQPAERANNHGRVFGPHPIANGWIFIAAFSRERLAPADAVKHRYLSFNRARDDLAQRLDLLTDYRLRGFVSLDNALPADDTRTTGDHDGLAVLLVAGAPRGP